MKFLTMLLPPLAAYALPQLPSPSPSASPCSNGHISCTPSSAEYSQCANGEFVSKGAIPPDLTCNAAGNGFTAKEAFTDLLLDFQVVNPIPADAGAEIASTNNTTTSGEGSGEVTLISGPAINVTLVPDESGNYNGNSTATPKLSKRARYYCVRICVAGKCRVSCPGS